MEIETVEDLASTLADWFGIYGGCKSDGDTGCELKEEKPFCCRSGFCQIMEERIRGAVENDRKLEQMNIKPSAEEKRECDHCGTKWKGDERCPECFP
jgi:hypothetical protein